MFRKAALPIVVLSVVFVLTGMWSREVSAQKVTVTVIQVKASNQGEKFTDPRLGALGRRLERTYPYRRYELVGRQTQVGKIGGSVNFGLQGGMALALGLNRFVAPLISMRVVVTRAGAQIMNSNLRAASGQPLILGFPWGVNRLIVVITPSVR